MVSVQASFDPADTTLWQLESEALPLSPIALWDTNLGGTQSGVHPFNCNESVCGKYSDVHTRAPGPVSDWDWDMRGQTYKGDVPVHHPTLQLPSSHRWSSQQCSSTCGDPDDIRSQSMLDMTVNSLKRARCMRAVADCGSDLRSGSLPSDSAANHLSSPWRKRMRRGFLFPAATSCSEDIGTASEEGQVMSLA